jgi:hypothetical protein
VSFFLVDDIAYFYFSQPRSSVMIWQLNLIICRCSSMPIDYRDRQKLMCTQGHGFPQVQQQNVSPPLFKSFSSLMMISLFSFLAAEWFRDDMTARSDHLLLRLQCQPITGTSKS